MNKNDITADLLALLREAVDEGQGTPGNVSDPEEGSYCFWCDAKPRIKGFGWEQTHKANCFLVRAQAAIERAEGRV